MTSIEWTHREGTKGETWNPIVAYRCVTDASGERKRLRGWYCEHATTGCINCYSEKQNVAGARGGTKLPYKPGLRDEVEIELHEPTLLKPLHWKQPRTIFVCSMTDLFGEFHSDEMIDRVFAVMALCPQHTFQVLTKRAERMREYLSTYNIEDKIVEVIRSIGAAAEMRSRAAPSRRRVMTPDQIIDCDTHATSFNLEHGYTNWPLPNVWLGISAERQQEADERIPLLLQTPAAIRFLSAEPLLGQIDLDAYLDGHEENGVVLGRPAGTCVAWTPPLDWVIVGGESGARAREFDMAWGRDLIDQCKRAEVACFVKQLGARVVGPHANGTNITIYGFKSPKGGDWNEWPPDLRIREFPNTLSAPAETRAGVPPTLMGDTEGGPAPAREESTS